MEKKLLTEDPSHKHYRQVRATRKDLQENPSYGLAVLLQKEQRKLNEIVQERRSKFRVIGE